MKEYYQFYYENKDGEIFQLGGGYYEQPRRTMYYKVMENLLDRELILSFGYQKIDL